MYVTREIACVDWIIIWVEREREKEREGQRRGQRDEDDDGELLLDLLSITWMHEATTAASAAMGWGDSSKRMWHDTIINHGLVGTSLISPLKMYIKLYAKDNKLIINTIIIFYFFVTIIWFMLL